jgi:uncharacterized coiled-coil protein SlyX
MMCVCTFVELKVSAKLSNQSESYSVLLYGVYYIMSIFDQVESRLLTSSCAQAHFCQTMCTCVDCKKYTNRCTCTFGRCGDPDCGSLTSKDNRCHGTKAKSHDRDWRNIAAGCQECQECWKHSDPVAWNDIGPKRHLIPLDFDAWLQATTQAAAPPGKGAADTGPAGAAAATGQGWRTHVAQQRIDLNFAEQEQRIDDLERRLQGTMIRIEELEKNIQDQHAEHEQVICQHADQIQELENKVYNLEWEMRQQPTHQSIAEMLSTDGQ